jgi:hypothetical protein
MPAHSGVSSKAYPCMGSQIPCSQMMSMKVRPPWAMAYRKPLRFPAVNMRMRKRARRNIGWRTRRSMKKNAARSSRPTTIPATTSGFPHPMTDVPCGMMP